MLSILQSQYTKNQFILAPFKSKLDLAVIILDTGQLQEMISPNASAEIVSKELLKDPFVVEVKNVMR